MCAYLEMTLDDRSEAGLAQVELADQALYDGHRLLPARRVQRSALNTGQQKSIHKGRTRHTNQWCGSGSG